MRLRRRPPSATETVEFVGYATDCVLRGEVAVEGDRLTDFLTNRDEYRVRHVSLEALDDGRVVSVEDAHVLREDLCVVVAAGPRGKPSRRLPTRTYPVRSRVGPYEVFGYLHWVTTSDPIPAARGRDVIPLTMGYIRYRIGSTVVQRFHEALLLVRAHAEPLEQVSELTERRVPP